MTSNFMWKLQSNHQSLYIVLLKSKFSNATQSSSDIESKSNVSYVQYSKSLLLDVFISNTPNSSPLIPLSEKAYRSASLASRKFGILLSLSKQKKFPAHSIILRPRRILISVSIHNLRRCTLHLRCPKTTCASASRFRSL